MCMCVCCVCFVCVFVLCILVIFWKILPFTSNGLNDTEFRFVYLEHAEFCFESATHDIYCNLSGNHCP